MIRKISKVNIINLLTKYGLNCVFKSSSNFQFFFIYYKVVVFQMKLLLKKDYVFKSSLILNSTSNDFIAHDYHCFLDLSCFKFV